MEKSSEDDLKYETTIEVPKTKENKSKLRTREMSVLQLKLTKLAIQIGYIGKEVLFYITYYLILPFIFLFRHCSSNCYCDYSYHQILYN